MAKSSPIYRTEVVEKVVHDVKQVRVGVNVELDQQEVDELYELLRIHCSAYILPGLERALSHYATPSSRRDSRAFVYRDGYINHR